jgi:hypothetical protein
MSLRNPSSILRKIHQVLPFLAEPKQKKLNTREEGNSFSPVHKYLPSLPQVSKVILTKFETLSTGGGGLGSS